MSKAGEAVSSSSRPTGARYFLLFKIIQKGVVFLYKKHSSDVYNKVIELRGSGLSINKIADKVGVSKSTVSRWLNLKDIPKEERVISDETRRKLSEAARKGNLQRVYKRKRIEEMKSFTHIRARVFEERGRICEECGWSRINPSTGTCPVQIHHKDGNRSNNASENLIVLCPNCHSITDNFMFYGRSHS